MKCSSLAFFREKKIMWSRHPRQKHENLSSWKDRAFNLELTVQLTSLISWLQWSCSIGLGMHLLRQGNVDSGARSSSAGNVKYTQYLWLYAFMLYIGCLDFLCAGVINWIWRYSRVDCYVSRFEDTVSELRYLKRTRNCFPAKAAWELP